MITVLINGVDRTSQISQDGFMVQQVLGEQRDTAHLIYKKYGSRSYVPAVLDTVLIKDGTTKIFGGRIMTINETGITPADGLQYQLECADYSVDLDALLVSETYENMTVHDIIADIIATYAPAFTYANVVSSYVVTKIVFNQVTISNCLKRLADILKYDWYVDPDKDVHFFGKYSNSAPFNLTDTSNNYVNKSLSRKLDGTQLTNQVKFRGGIYDAPTYTDKITVKGSQTKSFKLPYGFANLSIKVNGASKTVGIDFSEDTFATKDVLYNFNDQSFRFAAPLTDGDVIEYSGNPKQRLLQIAADAGSIAIYGVREKLVEDKDIVDPAIARKRAASELEAYKTQESMASFDTYTAGLRSGMLINLTSARRNTDTDFLIRSVTFSCFTADTYFYRVECVTVKKQTLTEILGSLLQPDAVNDDVNESNEFMQTDLRTVYVSETITQVNSNALPAGQKDIAVITVGENIQKDPLGAGVEPTWVVGYYFPSSLSDTKRQGLLNNSLKLY